MTAVRCKTAVSGYVLGVEFKDGVAETDAPAALAFFKSDDHFEVGDPKKSGKAAGDGAS